MDKSVTTRTIFKGHKLVLEMKQKDEDDNRFDWTIVKEYYPEPESPTAQNEVAKNRIGLKPSKTLEMIDRNYIFLSDLWKKESKEETLKYFTEVFVAEEDRPKVLEVDSEFLMEKDYLKVKLVDRDACHYFKTKYESQLFNGKSPRISVFLNQV